MGEFGFLTADGVYHVTVYATDENGNYKVLSMRNLRRMEPQIKELVTTIRESHKRLLNTENTPHQKNPEVVITTPTPPQTSTPSAFKVISTTETQRSLDVSACANCKILPPKTENNSQQPNPDDMKSNASGADADLVDPIPFTIHHQNDQENQEEPPQLKRNDDDSRKQNFNRELHKTTTNPLRELAAPFHQSSPVDSPINPKESFDNSGRQVQNINNPTTRRPPPSLIHNPEVLTSRHGFPLNGVDNAAPPQQPFTIQNRVSESQSGLLYKFNYTVGFHGHNEVGDVAGRKEGEYFNVGRDGIRRTVSYTADENGFHPIVKFETASDDEVPREETEKKAGLKGYEFKWFYAR